MSKLPFHEWLIISLLIAILLVLSFITLVKTAAPPPLAGLSHELSTEMINVTIKGAVREEGIYELKKGALMKDLLALAHPLPEANLSKLNLESRLRNNQIIKILKEQWISVTIEGAVVNPGSLRLKMGTLVKDLLETVAFLPEADLEKLNKKRRLKDGEIICVTIKKMPKKLKKNSVSQ